MRIKDISVENVSLADQDPNWKISGYAIPTNDACIVTVTGEDGTRGLGYAAAFAHLGATQAGTAEALGKMGKLLVGRDAFAIEANMKVVRGVIKGNNPAKGAMDCALHDLLAHHLKVPLYQLLGGKTRSRVPLLRILSIKSPDEMAQKSVELVDKGYRYLKLKVAGQPREDAARVKAVRDAVGADVFISVDPNMAYKTKGAIEFGRRIEDFDVRMMEQPLVDTDIAGLETVTRAIEIPVEADEAATSVEQVLDLAANRRVDAVNLKIPRSGGILSVMTIARICAIAGLDYRLGANVGSRLLAAHALHVAAALPDMGFACELGEFERLRNDPFEGIEVVDGELVVPDEVGVGVRRKSQ